MSTRVQTAIGTFVWHENISTDVKKANSFYSELLGWETEVFKPGEMDYPMIKVGEQTHGGFGKTQDGAPSHWMGHVLVENADEAAERARSAGGKVLVGPMDIPEVGRFAVIADPQGATLSAYASASEGPLGEGTFVWDELLTSDVDAAKRFYGDVFGWTFRDMDMGEATYTIFQRGDVDVAGAMRLREGMQAPPHWLSYVATDDVDRTAAKAKALGGTIHQEPLDIPEVGRFAIVQDPVGATFGLFKPIAQ